MHDDVKTLIAYINQWGIDRNITAEGGATVLAQMSKMTEEFAEFLSTYDKLISKGAEGAVYVALEDEDKCEEIGKAVAEIEEQLADDFGDMLVCLIQAMRLAGLTTEQCLSKAWEDIRYRKGTMINGKFVKES